MPSGIFMSRMTDSVTPRETAPVHVRRSKGGCQGAEGVYHPPGCQKSLARRPCETVPGTVSVQQDRRPEALAPDTVPGAVSLSSLLLMLKSTEDWPIFWLLRSSIVSCSECFPG